MVQLGCPVTFFNVICKCWEHFYLFVGDRMFTVTSLHICVLLVTGTPLSNECEHGMIVAVLNVTGVRDFVNRDNAATCELNWMSHTTSSKQRYVDLLGINDWIVLIYLELVLVHAELLHARMWLPLCIYVYSLFSFVVVVVVVVVWCRLHCFPHSRDTTEKFLARYDFM